MRIMEDSVIVINSGMIESTTEKQKINSKQQYKTINQVEYYYRKITFMDTVLYFSIMKRLHKLRTSNNVYHLQGSVTQLAAGSMRTE